jgi:hypothetical protein
MMNVQKLSLDLSLMVIINELLSFGTEIHHKDAYTLCLKCYLYVNNYKLGDNSKLWDYIPQI